MAIMAQHAEPGQPPGAPSTAVQTSWPPVEQRLAILAQFAGAGSLSVAPPAAASEQNAREEKKLVRDAARAMRRIREIAEEASRGELGAAAGHLFLGSPYSEGLNDPLGPIVRIEPTDPPAKPSDAEIKLNGVREAAKQDLDRRRLEELDERHLSDAEADRRGEPVIKDGRIYDHENEVAQGKQGLEHKLDDLEKKLFHEEVYGKSEISKEALDNAKKTANEIREFIKEINRRLPGLKVRQVGDNSNRLTDVPRRR